MHLFDMQINSSCMVTVPVFALLCLYLHFILRGPEYVCVFKYAFNVLFSVFNMILHATRINRF